MSDDGPSLDAFSRRMLQQHFDDDYYLWAYPDVAAAGVDPLLHYHFTGWREHRNPSRTFNTLYYLRVHADVARADMDPLLHYALSGQAEGRGINRVLDTWRQRLEMAVAASPPKPADKTRQMRTDLWLDGDPMLQLLRERVSGGVLIIAVSHDDYAQSIGGIQNLISDEQKAAAELGWHYLHVAPLHHCMTLASDQSPTSFDISLRFDAHLLGHTNMASLLSAVTRLSPEIARTSVVIHHMMAHSPELLAQLVQAANVRQAIVWAHDFFTACPSHTLLRNDVTFCGGPPPASAACMICCHGESRRAHLQRMQSFFDTVEPMMLFPSPDAEARWHQVVTYPTSGSAARPLARLLLADSLDRRSSGPAARPLRVAHIGGRYFHKGWAAFEELADTMRGDPAYIFYHIGNSDGAPLPKNIRHVQVRVTSDSRGAMIDAIARTGIDVAVNWSLWPETFCFAAYEAIAAGAFVLTNPQTGNVPRMLAELGARHGLVLQDRAALIALFRSGEIVSRVAGSRCSRAALLLGSGTVAWLQDSIGQPEVGSHDTCDTDITVAAHV